MSYFLRETVTPNGDKEEPVLLCIFLSTSVIAAVFSLSLFVCQFIRMLHFFIEISRQHDEKQEIAVLCLRLSKSPLALVFSVSLSACQFIWMSISLRKAWVSLKTDVNKTKLVRNKYFFYFSKETLKTKK